MVSRRARPQPERFVTDAEALPELRLEGHPTLGRQGGRVGITGCAEGITTCVGRVHLLGP